MSGPGDDPQRVSRIGDLAGRVARWSALHPRRVLLGAVVVLVLSLISLSRLQISSSLAVMLGTHSAAAAAMQRVASDYRSGDALLLLAELPAGRAADSDGHAELLAFAARLESALKADPAASGLVAWIRYREDPQFLQFAREVMLPNGAFYLTDEGAAELLRRLEPAAIREQFARNEAMIGAPGPAGVALSGGVLQDPLRLLELIPAQMRRATPGAGTTTGPAAVSSTPAPDAGRPEWSDDQRALLIHIGGTSAGGDYEAAGRLVDAVSRVAAEVNTTRLRLEPAGYAAVARDSSRVIRRDAIISCVVSVGLLYFLFWTFYRRWSAGLLIGGVAAVGMLAGIGALALVIKEVSPLSAMIAALLAGLGTDYGIHYLSHYDGYREQGLGSVDACEHTARHMAMPIITNCFTSIFGFISLWPSQIQMLRDFAVMGAAGLIGALVAVFVLMPAALSLIAPTADVKPAGRAAFGRIADVVAARPRRWMTSSLVLLGVLVIAAAAQGFTLRFESDLTVMHPRPARALDATGEVIRRFAAQGDLIPIEVRGSTPESLVSAAHELSDALDSPACRAVGVASVIGIHDLLPDPRLTQSRREFLAALDPDRALASFDAAVEASDFAPAAYAGYRSFLRTLVTSRHAPGVADLLSYPSIAGRLFPAVELDKGSVPTSNVLLVRFAVPLTDRLQRRAAIDTINAAAAQVKAGTATVAGLAAVSAELEDAARDGLPQSIALSFVLVLVWLMLVFRRPLDVLLALLPLAFAACATVLFIIATGQKFNPINSVAIPLIDGIAVDAGVFLVSVYRAHGATRAELLVNLRSTSHAVLLSVSTTVTAFAAICFTHTPAIRSLGFVSAVGIVASGVGALLLLMPLLLRRAPEASPNSAPPSLP